MISWIALLSVAQAEAPTVAACTVLRPSFTVGEKAYPAGTMFAAKAGEHTVLLTAHHLFGPAGGLPSLLTGPQVGEQVSRVSLTDAFSGGPCGTSETVRTVTDAAPMGSKGTATDLAVFTPKEATGLDRLQSTRARPELAPLPLAAADPKKGDSVWVAARVQQSTTRMWPAEVVEVSGTGLYYRFADSSLDLGATSGAPVLNAEGAVVGLHLGGGAMADGALVGAANPVSSVRSRVQAALGD
ncbi:MAG: serine protease [Myxococcales bacterium]|nr:serine protease [Myxococcales bacterium]